MFTAKWYVFFDASRLKINKDISSCCSWQRLSGLLGLSNLAAHAMYDGAEGQSQEPVEYS